MAHTDFDGSCLCGAVQYSITGDVKRFYHCHCSRCRKATGTGHATNLMVKPETLVWRVGEEQIGTYKVPEAERFFTRFCKVCGSPLPRHVPEIGMVVIPAGSLDNELLITPQARIFYESRTEWSCGGDGLPIFAEYPPAI